MAENQFTIQYEENPQKMNKAQPFWEPNINVDGTERESHCVDSKNSRPPIKITVKHGNLEDQKVDILVYPLCAGNPNLNVLNVTKDLQAAAGEKFSNLFNLALNGRPNLKAGSLFEMPVAKGSHSLDSLLVIFLSLLKWDGCKGSALPVLRKGISDLLQKCSSKNMESIAFPALGTGIFFAFPPKEAATIIGEEIKCFVERNPDTSIKEIHIVVKQLTEHETIFIAYRETLAGMDLGQRILVCNENGECFPKMKIGDNIEKKFRTLSVSVVFGDIVEESTNAVVNSTNFVGWKKGTVANAIFSKVDEEIVQEAKRGYKAGKKVVITSPGDLKSNWIFHCNCEKSVDTIKNLLASIFDICHKTGLKSVSIPAIGTGECRLCPTSVAKTMMKAISCLAEENKDCPSTIRLIANTPYIYHIFCTELQTHA
ncbi:protein mono-ADP-ribosyltransferase PARP14-like [Hyperolius riggenbachi]|uniref:protein mono-ADP-ribosyltransferase PARP14-like n=1 Tax=Hyperolius riggenbachi TaxID=752182 RepID=UPI0035A265C8